MLMLHTDISRLQDETSFFKVSILSVDKKDVLVSQLIIKGYICKITLDSETPSHEGKIK